MTLQNFILEQDINEASVDDILLEQAIAEFEVASALLDCAIKQSIILEYATVDEGSIYMEANDDKADKSADFKAKFKAKGTAIKNFFKKAWNVVLASIDKFIDSLSHTNFKALKKRVEKNVGSEVEINVDISILQKILAVAEQVEKLGDFREDTPITNDYVDQLKAFSDSIDAALGIKDVTKKIKAGKKNKDEEESVPDYTPERMLMSKNEIINYLTTCDELQSEIGGFREIKRKLTLKDFDPGKQASDNAHKFSEEIKKIYTSIAKKLANQFIQAAKSVKALVNAVVRGEAKVNATNKKDEFFKGGNELFASENKDRENEPLDDSRVGSFDVDDLEAARARNASSSRWGGSQSADAKYNAERYNRS